MGHWCKNHQSSLCVTLMERKSEYYLTKTIGSTDYEFKCPHKNGTDLWNLFMGNHLFKIDNSGNLVTANSMKSVEAEYISQHDDIYSDQSTYPDIQNVKVNGMAWFARECFCKDYFTQDKTYMTFSNNDLIDCPTYTNNGYLGTEPLDTFLVMDYLLYPNPSSGKLNLKLNSSSTSAPISLAIYNIQGAVVWNKEMVDKPLIEIDLHELSDGMYLLVLEKAGKTETFKFLLK